MEDTVRAMKVEAMNGALVRLGLARSLLDMTMAVTITSDNQVVSIPLDVFQIISEKLEETDRLLRQIKNKEELDAPGE